MEIQLWPNAGRPGVGAKPRSESQRPLLSQHARHCPVLEAGNGLGYLVYPPLEKNEAYFVDYHGDGRYEFKYFMSNPKGGWDPYFSVTWKLPIGSVGRMQEDVAFAMRDPPVTEEGAIRMARAFVIPEDLGTPPGAVTLRGAYNFKTPQGWDTVYGPVLNMVDPPLAAMLVVRVETDWYAHHSEFRYVMQPGQGLPGSHSLPIGQVYFVPRGEIKLRDVNQKELEEINKNRKEFSREKVEQREATRYGFEYSPHYARQSRAHRDEMQQETQEERKAPSP